MTRRFDLNPRNVAAKVMDGEAIIINLASGVYYSMDKAGATLWSLIQAGYNLDECTGALARLYNAAPERVRGDVERVAEELLREELIIHSDRRGSEEAAVETVPLPDLVYEPPQLNIYRDMGDLLALDPPTPGLQVSPWGNPESGEGAS